MSSAAPMPAGADDVRGRILDGAEYCLERYGLQKTTIEDIAKAAGISRVTVYRHVEGGRDEIILQVLLRLCAREMTRLAEELPRTQRSFGEQLVEGIVQCVVLCNTDTRMALLFSPQIIGYTGGITGAADELIDGLAMMLQPLLAVARLNDEVDVALGDRDIAQFVCHQMVATLILRTHETQTEDGLRFMLTRFLLPGLRPPA